MEIFISRNGERIGSWDDEDVRRFYQSGQLVATDHYWRPGMEEWDTLGNLYAVPLGAAPVTRIPAPVEAKRAPARRKTLRMPAVPVSWIAGGAAAILALLAILTAGLMRHHTAPVNSPAIPTASPPPPATTPQITSNAETTTTSPQNSGTGLKLSPPTDASPVNQKLSDVSASILQDLSTNLKVCQDAEAPLPEMGFSPAKMLSLDELEKRHAALQTALPAIQNFIAYLQNMDTTVQGKLASEGVSDASARAFLDGFQKSGKIAALQAYWNQESAILTDLLGNLNLLQAQWGHWHVTGDSPVFDDAAARDAYTAGVAKLTADIATQKADQQQVLSSAPAPANGNGAQ